MEITKHYASFSEAIREGAKLRPQQARNRLFEHGATCAAGAGLEAMGLTDADCVHGFHFGKFLIAAYPYLGRESVCPQRCPDYVGDGSVLSVVTHLNDMHRWTREAIADWLEKEEEKLGYVTVIDNEMSFSTQNVGSEVLALT